METLFWIISGTFLVSLLGFVGVFTLSFREEQVKKLVFLLTSFAIGGLLGGTFFHLLPEALEQLQIQNALMIVLIGFLSFLVIETYFHWHLCNECDVHPYSYMMLIGDAIHNLIDGSVITGAFIVSVPLGLATTLVIFGHEFPQQLGLFGVLVSGGFDRKKAILYSFMSQSTIIAGGVLSYLISTMFNGISTLLIPFAAGGFIYIAASDLVPEMHKEEGMNKVISIVLIIMGILFMWALKTYMPEV